MGDCAAGNKVNFNAQNFYIFNNVIFLGHRPENREKNRNVLNVPPDEWRPYLTSFQVGIPNPDFVPLFISLYKIKF